MRFKVGQSWQKLLTEFPYDISRESNVSAYTSRRQPRSEATETASRQKGSGAVKEVTEVAYLRVPTPSSARRRDRRLEYRLTTVSAGYRFSFPPSSRPHDHFWDSSIVYVSRSPPPFACAVHPLPALPTTLRHPGAIIAPSPRLPAAAARRCIFLHTLAHSEAFKLLCLSRDIARYLLSVRFACNKSNRALPYFPRGHRDYTIHLYHVCADLPISNDVVCIVG